eukprot:3785139-Rhodomonas_salina.1
MHPGRSGCCLILGLQGLILDETVGLDYHHVWQGTVQPCGVWRSGSERAVARLGLASVHLNTAA